MLKRVLLTVVCSIGLSVPASARAQTVLNFDDLTGPNFVPGGYGGLTWTIGWFSYDYAQDPYNAHSGSTRVYFNGYGEASFSFATPTIFNGAWFAGYYTTYFDMYLGGSLVATSSSLALSDTPGFLASGYYGDVDRVVVNGHTDLYVMDDLTYGGAQTVTPEPLSMTLLASGLAGVAAVRRRQRRHRDVA